MGVASSRDSIVPRRHLLFKRLYEGGYIGMYGTAQLRRILEIDTIEGYPLETFDSLVTNTVNRRRNLLSELLMSGRPLVSYSISATVRRPWMNQHLKNLLLNVYLMPENFQSVVASFEEIHTAVNNSTIDLETVVRQMINLVLPNDDYLANWGNFPLFVNLPNNQDITQYSGEEALSSFMDGMISLIINKYKTLSTYEIKQFIASRPPLFDDNGFRVISVNEGTALYRGYKGYRGRLTNVKPYAWFGFDVISIMNYMLPPAREDNLNYVKEARSFDHLREYCEAIGGVAIYETTKPLKVLDFGDLAALTKFKEFIRDKQAPAAVIKAFDEGWQLNVDTFIRQSVDRGDFILVDWLCSMGFDGYITIGLQSLHDEIMLCGVQTKVEYVRDLDIARALNFHVCSPPYADHDLYLLYW